MDKRPFVYLWKFDPQTGIAHVEAQRGEHPADFKIHETMAEHVVHPEHTRGYAIAIKDGWRIFDNDFKEPDPFIKKRIEKALMREHPPAPLPHVRYHGAPA